MYKAFLIYCSEVGSGGRWMNNRSFVISETAGCAAVLAGAAFLHAAVPLFGSGALTILFGAVNESVWEHVKVLSAAYAGYALLQLMWIETDFRAYVAAKCAGLYLLMGSYIFLRCGCAAFMEETGTVVAFLSAGAAVVFAQLLTFRLMESRLPLRDWFMPALFLLTLYYLMFFSFTVLPPKAELFKDPITGGFGCRD